MRAFFPVIACWFLFNALIVVLLTPVEASEATLRPMPKPHMEPVIGPAPVKQEAPVAPPTNGEPAKKELPKMQEPAPPPKKPDTWRIKRWWS
jgi:hypothetical protein